MSIICARQDSQFYVRGCGKREWGGGGELLGLELMTTGDQGRQGQGIDSTGRAQDRFYKAR